MVHLLAGGPEQQLVSVKLAEDDKDEQLQPQAEAELSEDKRGMVERILAASTLGEVLSAGLASLKSAFRRRRRRRRRRLKRKVKKNYIL